MTNNLPPFSVNPTCPKCGGTRVRVFWQAAFTDPIGGRDLPECVVRTCKHCHYDWRELPLDATPSAHADLVITGNPESKDAAEPSIPVSRIVAVLAERYMSMHDGAQIRMGVDRANYHIRSLEDAWVSAAFGVDHEFDAAIRAELARRKGTA